MPPEPEAGTYNQYVSCLLHRQLHRVHACAHVHACVRAAAKDNGAEGATLREEKATANGKAAGISPVPHFRRFPGDLVELGELDGLCCCLRRDPRPDLVD